MCLFLDSLNLDIVKHFASKAVCIRNPAGLANPAFLISHFSFKFWQNKLYVQISVKEFTDDSPECCCS